ncbi:unnamed protein product [Orchesella dallaii]|uniref:General transcription factor 3C polypeptide 3 n=1 Tax=Orchesella dallaii TaxID=48710 RepID=A0ABP1Q9Q7_9HEXA
MEETQSGDCEGSKRKKGARFTTTPVFVNTEDLVNISLGLHPPETGVDESAGEAEEVFQEHSEMEVEYEDEESSEAVHDTLHAATQGLSNYYNVSEEDERIRNVTNEYLEGRLSLLEFAAAMEHYGKLGTEVEVDAEEEEVASLGKKPIPSLVLLTPETAESSFQPQPGSSQQMLSEAESVKLRGEFFRSGDQLATFTVRKRRKMPPTIKNLMGEAHVRFARGDLSGAETICMEVIKEQPTYKDPFHTLAMIYENQGNRQKSLQFYLICALLDPKRFDDWPRLAEMSVEEDNTQQAIMCLNKAVSVEPGNVKLHLRRCQLLKDSGDHKAALKGYQKVYQISMDGKIHMDVAKEIAHLYFQMDEIDKAYEILIDTFRSYSEHVTHYELNLLSEVCITVKKYVEALQMFIEHGSLQFTPSIQDADFESREALTESLSVTNKRECVLQAGLHSDLIQKIVIVLIHLEAFKFAEQIVNRLLAVEDINDFGLQFFEIAEAYIAKKENRAALRLLNPLINSDNYSEAEVWLRYAECLYMINKLEDAAAAYEKVISLAPNHKIAKLNLSIILQRLGKYDGALESLDQNDMEELIDHDLLLERCKIFLNRGRLSELYDTALQLFSRHCPQLRNFEETQVLIVTSHTQQQLEGLKALRLRKQEPITDMTLGFEDKPLENPFKEWTVYVSLLRIFLYMGRYDLFSRLAYTAWASKLFSTEPLMKQDMDFHCALAATINGDQDLTPLHYRSLFSTYKLNTAVFNMFGLAFRLGTKYKYGRQIIRMLKKQPSDIRLMWMSAHNSFITGTYKYALIEYLQIIAELPTNPLSYLMVAITLMHMVSQRTISNRVRLVLYMIGFLRKYLDLRGRCQESYFNLARAYHFLGFYRQALRYYKKVLTNKPVKDDKFYGGIPCKDDGSVLFVYGNQFDLKQEAAYNIAHIYKLMGLYSHARMYLFKYITV